MKLSQIETGRVADVLCEVVECADDILSNGKIREKIEELAKFGKGKSFTKMQYLSMGVKMLSDMVPYLLVEKRSQVFRILAALNDTTVEEVEKQKFGETCAQVKEIFNDEELLQLFT